MKVGCTGTRAARCPVETAERRQLCQKSTRLDLLYDKQQAATLYSRWAAASYSIPNPPSLESIPKQWYAGTFMIPVLV